VLGPALSRPGSRLVAVRPLEKYDYLSDFASGDSKAHSAADPTHPANSDRKGRQVHLRHRIKHVPHEMTLRQPLAQRRRHQESLIPIHSNEVLSHPEMVITRPDRPALRNSLHGKGEAQSSSRDCPLCPAARGLDTATLRTGSGVVVYAEIVIASWHSGVRHRTLAR